MLKMLIADDEKIIREGIEKIVNWEEFGIEIVGTTCDGKEAMDMYDRYSPEIVITDIKMPKIDGLELTKYLKSKNSQVKVIILSGYDEFAYAQEALKLGALDYINKPVIPNELVERIIGIKEDCEAENKKIFKEMEFRRQISEMLPLLKEKFLYELIKGNFPNSRLIFERIHFLNLNIGNNGLYGVILIAVDGYETVTDEYTEISKQALHMDMLQAIKECLKNKGEVFNIKSGEYCVVFNMSGDREIKDMKDVEDLADKIRDRLQIACNISTTVAIGRVYEDILMTKKAYIEACETLKYKIFLGNGQVISAQDIGSSVYTSYVYPEKVEKDILFSLRNADKNGINRYVDDFFNCGLEKIRPEYVKWMGMKLLFSISMDLMDIENIRGIIENEFQLWDQLMKYDSLHEIKLWLKNLSERIIDNIIKNQSTSSSKLVKKVIEYLNDNYSQRFSLSKISEEIYLSPNYICSLFKQETGQNISDYLMLLRIEKSKLLLDIPKFKIYEVSRMVGYEDSRYFCKIFKKQTGMNPSEYREKYGK